MRMVEIGRVVDRVGKWDPRRNGAGTFTYIDLSSVDRSTKAVAEPTTVDVSEAPSRARQLIAAGDVLVSTVRPNLNAVAHVQPDLDGATASTGFCVLRPRPDELDGRYLYHWVRAAPFIGRLVHLATGASYPAVSDKIVKAAPIPLPPIKEQGRIAAVLDAAEALRAKRRLALAKLDSLTQAVFFDMFGSESLELVPLADLADFKYGTSEKAAPAGLATLRIPNVVRGEVSYEDIKRVPVSVEELSRLRLSDGDLLFVRSNGNPQYVGRCAVFSQIQADQSCFAEPIIYASYLIRARLRQDRIRSIFACAFLNGPLGRRALRSKCRTSAGQYNLNTKGLGSVLLPLPPVPMQDAFSERMACVKGRREACQEQLAHFDALRASLQRRAFRGEL